MYFRLFFCVCLAYSTYGVRAQEPGDTVIYPLHYRYSAITLFTGDAWQFFPRVRGTMAISFPYTVTDASGVFQTNVFTGQIADPSRGVRSYPLPLLFELGRLHHFTNFGLAFPMINGMFSGGFRTSAGYGFLLYAGKRRMGDRRPVARRYAIKFSFSMSYTSNGPGARSLAFGSIDNLKKTVYFLGLEADPTFTTPVGRSGRETEVANDMKVYYSQREAVLLPRVSFAANPYRSGWRWEVQLGAGEKADDGAG